MPEEAGELARLLVCTMEQKSRKYRYTKQLINMAIRDGWNQTQIAKECRTQQSVVSKWQNGIALATEQQLRKLLEIYGPRLRRKSFRIYHRWLEVPGQEPEVKLIKVEGEVIFTHAYHAYLSCPRCNPDECRDSRHPKKAVPQRRIIIHDQGAGKFCIVEQTRTIIPTRQTQFADANTFYSFAIGQLSVDQLLAELDGNQPYEGQKDYSTDKLMIRMLVRKALLEHGVPLDGVEEHLMVC